MLSLRCHDSLPGGSLPLVICARPESGPPSSRPFCSGWRRVADLVELLADRRLLDGVLVGLQRGLAVLERVVDRLAGQDARLDAVVDALERHRVDHAGRVADEQRARHRQLGHRPVAAARQRLGAPADALAALEDPADQRVRLELLQQVVGRRGGVGVVELDDEADRDQVLPGLLVLHRVDPGAADLAVLRRQLQRPRADRVDQAIQRLGDLPDLLDPELPDLGLGARGQVELADRGTGEVAPAALGQHRELRGDVRAGLEVAQRLRRPCRGPCRRSGRRGRGRPRRAAAWPPSRSARTRRPPRPAAAGSGPAPRPR